jgi:hypothetical protein
MVISEYYKKLKTLSFYEADEQVDLILNLLKDKTQFAYARFNDGEMMGIDKIGAVAARGDQPVNESLHNKLIEGIRHVQENYYVGLPCPNCFPYHAKLARELVKQPEEFQLSPVVMTNRNWGKFVTKFPNVVKDRKILWISGADQNLDILKNEMKLNIVKHLKHPAKDTWTHYDVITSMYIDYTNENADFDLVMISSGPTARVMCKEMFEVDPTRTYIDIGSTFDPFTRNVWHNCHKGWIETGFNLTKRCKICN